MYLIQSDVLQKSVVWIVLFAICVCAVVVPAPLVEFRYFVVPVFIVQLEEIASNRDEGTTSGLFADTLVHLLHLLIYSVINAATMYIFLQRPFTGTDNESHRFMW